MIKANYHTHTTGSDGEMTPRELINLAIANNIKILGITDHIELPCLNEGFFLDISYSKGFYSDEHYNALRLLQKEYTKKIKLLVGAEFDWLSMHKEQVLKKAVEREYDLDALLVCVHYLPLNGKYISIDDDSETFGKLIMGYGGIKNLVKEYYQQIKDAVKTKKFGVVGHINKITMFNKENKFFSEKDEWYKYEQLKTLEIIAQNNLSLEINTSEFKTKDQTFIDLNMINEAKKLGIKMQIGSDVHTPKDIIKGLEEASKLIQ